MSTQVDSFQKANLRIQWYSKESKKKSSNPSNTKEDQISVAVHHPKTYDQTSVAIHHPRATTRERNSLLYSEVRNKLDHYKILKYPLVTEFAMKMIVNDNTLTFVVDIHANKKNIRDAVEKMFSIQTKKVNTLINFDGTKKAYIKLTKGYSALDLAKKIKII
ncbi:hypothetical protein RJ639_017198 [Escallonia herrerae]|uniref:50S ribosomal protein L23, chloroplastic n=1 Tax=Escallonia herrerae TaxID=1293975 RepID=A0AA89AK11_9ASTE|nr:hypothetical protein RJ639_017198 [Escallonia herrerae]